MAFPGITVDSIIGDETSGVQSRFPRFTFDETSRPTLEQVQKYADSAINNVTRTVRFKGYDPIDLADPRVNYTADEDMKFIQDWIELAVCAEVNTALDNFKDSRASNIRYDQLQQIQLQLQAVDDAFPNCPRRVTSESQHEYPSHMIRVSPCRLDT